MIQKLLRKDISMLITSRGLFHIKFLLLLLIVLVGCVKEKPCTNDGKPSISNIKEEDRLKIPYQSFAELTFIDSITLDTPVFYGQGWKQNYWHYFNQGRDPHCYYGTNFELYRQSSVSPTYPNAVSVGLEFEGESLSPDLIVSLNHLNYYTYPSALRKPYNFDSLEIRDKLYKDVRLMENDFQFTTTKRKHLCYYNIAEGIIKIQLIKVENSPETTLELINFKNP